jgi:adenylate cyclase class 2
VPHEIEIKLRLTSVDEGRQRLREAGFRLSKRRVFEANTLYDTSRKSLGRTGRLLRLREVKGSGKVTFKGPCTNGKHKSREELEVDVTDPKILAEMLVRLDYVPAFRYEKFRTEYRRKGEAGHAMLDETPIGVYLELEGAPAWIDRNARRLGFREAGYITASYGALYADYCRQHGRRIAHMTFGKR